MVNLPNMMPEVIEAIHLFHEDNPDVELDCMLFLKRLVADDPKMLSSVIEWFEENSRCIKCGEELVTLHYHELHTELDERPFEKLIDSMCPDCDYPITIPDETLALLPFWSSSSKGGTTY